MLKIQINIVGDIYLTFIGEAAKKFFYQRPFRGEGGKRPAIKENNFFELFFVAIKLEGRGGGIKALMAQPLKKNYGFP